MLKKAALFAVLFSFVLPVFSQHELNAYKYIIIPKKYDFLKTENQYLLNSFTKHRFDQLGYATLIQGEALPKEVVDNPCLAATVDVKNESNSFTTKLILVLNNCSGNTVFTSKQGTSKIKEFDKTYKDALKKCFESIEELNYKYDATLLVSEKDPQENMAGVVPAENSEKPAVKTAAAIAVVGNTPALPEPEKSEEVAQAMAEPVAAGEVKAAQEEVSGELSGVAAISFRNEWVTFFLIEQKGKQVAYVIDSKNAHYKRGEVIGVFEKTSLAKVYRVNWKKEDEAVEQTTAYFDDAGNLNIDVHRNGKIEVLTFAEEK